MSGLVVDRRLLIVGGAGATAMAHARGAGAAQRPLAPTPPMGWNSWNSFATTITEEQTIEQARIMARTLLPFG